MFPHQAVPLSQRGSARLRARKNHIAMRTTTGPAVPGHPHDGTRAAHNNPDVPQGTSTITLLLAELTNTPLLMLHSPTYPDRINREHAFADPNQLLYVATSPEPPTDLQHPLCLRAPPSAQQHALQSHNIDSLLLTGHYSTADTSVALFYVWHGVYTPDSPNRNESQRNSYSLHSPNRSPTPTPTLPFP